MISMNPFCHFRNTYQIRNFVPNFEVSYLEFSLNTNTLKIMLFIGFY